MERPLLYINLAQTWVPTWPGFDAGPVCPAGAQGPFKVPDLVYADPEMARRRWSRSSSLTSAPRGTVVWWQQAYVPREQACQTASGQQLYQEHLTRLRLKDRDLLDTPDGVVGPLERGFTRYERTWP